MDRTLDTYTDEEWYAMRATYRRELQARSLLESSGIKCYIPMRKQDRTVGGRRQSTEVPAVHNLIFVRTTRERLRQFKERVPFLQYMMDRKGDGKSAPIVVPEKEMDDFMRVMQCCTDAVVEYLPVGHRVFLEGMKVRLHGGPLDGVEGVLARNGKSKDRKLVVRLSSVLSVATASVSADSVEVL